MAEQKLDTASVDTRTDYQKIQNLGKQLSNQDESADKLLTNEMNKKLDAIHNIVYTNPTQRTANGIKAFANGLAANIDLLESKEPMDNILAISNILGGVAAAFPPPYGEIGGAIFGCISSAITIMQAKPSQMQIFQQLISYQTQAIKQAIALQTIEFKKELQQYGGQTAIASLAASVKLASQHLYNPDFLASNKELSAYKMQEIQHEIGNRIKTFSEAQEFINFFYTLEVRTKVQIMYQLKNQKKNEDIKNDGDADKQELDSHNQFKEFFDSPLVNISKHDKDNADKKNKKLSTLDSIRTGVDFVGKFDFGSGLSIFGKIFNGIMNIRHHSQSEQKADDQIKQAKQNIEDDKQKIIAYKSLMENLRNVRYKLLSLYCTLGILHNAICLTLTSKLNAKAKDKANSINYGYTNVAKQALFDDILFIMPLLYDYDKKNRQLYPSIIIYLYRCQCEKFVKKQYLIKGIMDIPFIIDHFEAERGKDNKLSFFAKLKVKLTKNEIVDKILQRAWDNKQVDRVNVNELNDKFNIPWFNPIKQYEQLKNIKVLTDLTVKYEEPKNYVEEIENKIDKSFDINKNFGGKTVWLEPTFDYVFNNYGIGVSGFQLIINDEELNMYGLCGDLVKDAERTKDCRYLRLLYDGKFVVKNVCLYRSENPISKLFNGYYFYNGQNGIVKFDDLTKTTTVYNAYTDDLNKGRGDDYLYLLYNVVSMIDTADSHWYVIGGSNKKS